MLIGLHRRGRATLLDTLFALPRERASESELNREAWAILDLVGLAPRAAELAGALPYGDQRLVGVALALAAEPSMLLLDEPVSGMNASETANFMTLLGTIKAQGITILLVEHDMPMVMAVPTASSFSTMAASSPKDRRPRSRRTPDVIAAYLGHGVPRGHQHA